MAPTSNADGKCLNCRKVLRFTWMTDHGVKKKVWPEPGYRGNGYFCSNECAFDYAVKAAKKVKAGPVMDLVLFEHLKNEHGITTDGMTAADNDPWVRRHARLHASRGNPPGHSHEPPKGDDGELQQVRG